MLQYDYNWGDEDVLGASIQVIKEHSTPPAFIYIITLVQEGFEPSLFHILSPTPEYGCIKCTSTTTKGDCGITVLTTTMVVRALNNPRPETLFRIVSTSAEKT